MTTDQLSRLETPIEGLYATPPEALSFAPDTHVRAFLLPREQGNLVVYNAPGLAPAAGEIAARGDVAGQYLNHAHEAMFGPQGVDAPLLVHERDAGGVAESMPVGWTFTGRHMLDDDFEVIPIPGHTPGATAYLWDSGHHRFLFTGDSLYLKDGGWRVAVLGSSDRDAYLDSLALIAEEDFDVLVPWAATAGEPYVAVTSRAGTQRRIAAIVDRLQRA